MSINLSDFEDDKPQFIREDSNYDLLKYHNLNSNLYIQTEKLADYSTLSITDLSNIPGSWLYTRYTEQNLQLMRLWHLIGLVLEFLGLVLGEALIEAKDTQHSVTPFSPQHFFILSAWAGISFLGISFVLMLFSRTLTSREIIANQLGYMIYIVYILHSIYLALRNLTENIYINMICTLLLFVLSIFIYLLYQRIKYRDDGRFIVSRFEYYGVHARFSTLLSWTMLCMIHRVFVCLSFSDNTQDILGWSNDNWSILAICLFFALGVIFLTSYKDVFFNIMVIYSFIGIFIMQSHNTVCRDELHENCSSKVGTCAISLAAILIIFIVITSILHYDLVCYKKSDN